MLAAQSRLSSSCQQRIAAAKPIRAISTTLPRRKVIIEAKFGGFGGFGKKDGGDKGGSEDAAKKAIEDMFSKNKFGYKDFKTDSGAGGGGGGGDGGYSGGGGGGGGGGGFFPPPAGDSGPEKPWRQEILELVQGMLMWGANCALFLILADIMHRTVDWFAEVELLAAIGAGPQAWDRVKAKWFEFVEFIEGTILGWNIGKEEENMAMYENLKHYYPERHAYSYEQYRHNMTDKEQETLRNYYGLRWFERDGGYQGDVEYEDVKKIEEKYNPEEVDRKEYIKARQEGRLAEYWKTRKATYDKYTGAHLVDDE